MAAALPSGIAAGESHSPAAASAEGAQPNVLVVMTDDETYRDARYMPNFRRLERRGTTFTNAFVSFPICCPARATFLTGQYAHNHGVKSNFFVTGGGFESFAGQDETLPVWLQRAGYSTAFVGKYLNEYGGQRPGAGPARLGRLARPRRLLDLQLLQLGDQRQRQRRYYGDREYADALIELAHAGVSGDIDTPAEGARHGAGAVPAVRVLRHARTRPTTRSTSRGGSPTARSAAGRRASSRSSSTTRRSPRTARATSRGSAGSARRATRSPTRARRSATRTRSTTCRCPRDPSFNEADVSDKPETVSGRDRARRRRRSRS